MVDDTVPCFGFPAVGRKKVTAAFDGGRLTSDGGVMLLSLAERRLGIAERLARLKPTAAIMHPGPMNRGVEISSEAADAVNSRVLDQVSAGVAVRAVARRRRVG